jgi:hypothetical protein
MPRLSDNFKKGIEMLDFEVSTSKESNLLFTADFGKKGFSAKEVFILETAKIYKADAVYIRKFQDSRTPIAQIYIYDNTAGKLTDPSIAEIHKNLWSSCIIPLFIVITKSKILFYDSRKPVTTIAEELVSNPFEQLDFAAESIKLFSSRLFDNGTFWELNENKNRFLANTTAYQDLIEGLKRIRTKFTSDSGLPAKTAHKLLVHSILIKYLEERGYEGESMFAKTFFQRNFGVKDFCDILRKKGKIVDLFDRLGEQFNGKVFEWNDAQEVKLIKNADLGILADYLDGNNKNNQYLIWRLYSFAHLPVELISTVYEEFLGKEKKDVVYTPDYLVSLLIDESLPIASGERNIRLLDGSCGSGIFLVKAYKRLVEKWRYEKYLETGELPAANLRVLKQILRDSIYGVDIEEDAVRLSIFSLALALCDMLTPKQIWTELRFDDLSETNIVTQDFFRFCKTKKSDELFDILIGNPPFKELNKKDFDKTVGDNKLDISIKIPQNQIALLYLDQAMKLLKPGAKLCLILPAGPLLYNDTIEFRKHFFSRFNVNQVIDFTNLSAVLFGKANVAVAALFVENTLPNNDPIIHVTVRRTKASKEKLYFELDHYDFHWVSKEEALYEKYVWKSNLLGGGRMYHLVNRLAKLSNLGNFLKKKIKENDWVAGEGFIRGTEKDKIADYLTNKKAILGKNFTKEGYTYEKLDVKYFYRRGPKELFSAPLLLIKEIVEDNFIPTALLNSDTPFDSRIVGIHAPAKDRSELKKLNERLSLNMKTNVFYIISTGSQSLVSFATAIQKKDIMNLPYPENDSALHLNYTEKILRDDVLNFQIEYLLKGDSSVANSVAKKDDLTKFGSTFCKAINSIYKQGEKEFSLSDVYESTSLFVCCFKYSGHQDQQVKFHSSVKTDSLLDSLIQTNTGQALRITRVLKIYENNKIYLIKPKQIRYWLKSIALRDVDETLDEILEKK